MRSFDDDPGTDPAYCEGLSEPPFICGRCGSLTLDDTCWPFCSDACWTADTADQAEADAAKAREFPQWQPRKGAA